MSTDELADLAFRIKVSMNRGDDWEADLRSFADAVQMPIEELASRFASPEEHQDIVEAALAYTTGDLTRDESTLLSIIGKARRAEGTMGEIEKFETLRLKQVLAIKDLRTFVREYFFDVSHLLPHGSEIYQ